MTAVSASWQRRTQFHEVGQFAIGEAVEIGGLLIGDDHEVAAGVGISIEDGVAGCGRAR